MPDLRSDQADGLRRLFRRAPPGVAFVGGRTGSGATRIACAFARGLAAGGARVSLVDEHRGEAGAAAVLNARARFDLWQAINGDALITQTVVLAGDRLRLVPAARLAQHRDPLDAPRQARLEQCWRAVSDDADAIVIDALAGSGGRLSPLVAKTASLVLVTGVDSAAVMAAYLVLKQIVLSHPQLRLGLVVNRALDASQAAAIAENLRGLLQDQLGRRLEGVAWLPRVPAWRSGVDAPAPPGLEGLYALLPDSVARRSADTTIVSERNFPGGAPLTPATAA